jgi:uncharacterized phage-associated protein
MSDAPMTTPREPIRFRFNERKAAAAASLLLELAGGTMEYLRLIKLLYYADRESLDTLGRPISGDRYYSLPHGPVLSRVYDLVKAIVFGPTGTDVGPWGDHIEGAGRYGLHLKKQPDMGALSEAEVNILTQVFRQYRERDKWDLRDGTHALPEWNDPGGSAREIRVEMILEVLGKSDSEIEEIRQHALETAHFDRVFGA